MLDWLKNACAQNLTVIHNNIALKWFQFSDDRKPEICDWIEALRQLQYFIDLQTEQFTIGAPLDYQLESEYNEQMFKIVNGFTDTNGLLTFLYNIESNLRVFLI